MRKTSRSCFRCLNLTLISHANENESHACFFFFRENCSCIVVLNACVVGVDMYSVFVWIDEQTFEFLRLHTKQ